MKTDKILFFVLILFLALSFFVSTARADQYQDKKENPSRARIGEMQEDADGVLEKNEFEFISTNESITRSWCPYDCSTRGIPKEKCRTWKSIQDSTKCYVQDLRIPSHAIEFK